MNYSAYVGLDVHKATIAIAIAEVGRNSEVRFFGELANSPDAVAAMLKKLAIRHAKLHFVYEAGPCGYGLSARLLRRATPARSPRPLTRRAAPAIASRLTGATRSCWLGCRAPAS